MGFLAVTNMYRPLVGVQLVSQLYALTNPLLDLSRKPRNRSEWENPFVFWQKPASDIEPRSPKRQIQSAAQCVTETFC